MCLVGKRQTPPGSRAHTPVPVWPSPGQWVGKTQNPNTPGDAKDKSTGCRSAAAEKVPLVESKSKATPSQDPAMTFQVQLLTNGQRCTDVHSGIASW